MSEDIFGPARIAAWLAVISGDESHAAIARRIGMPQRTFAAHAKKDRLGPEVVVAISRAYNADPLESLEIHGYIRQDEIDAHVARASLGRAPLRTALESIVERLDELDGLAQYRQDKLFAEMYRSEYVGAQVDLDDDGDRSMPDPWALAAKRGTSRLVRDDAEAARRGEESQDPGHDEPS